MKKNKLFIKIKASFLLILLSFVSNLLISGTIHAGDFPPAAVGKFTGITGDNLGAKFKGSLVNHCNGTSSGVSGSEFPDDMTNKANFISRLRSLQTNGYGTLGDWGRCTGTGGANVTNNIIGAHFIMSVLSGVDPNANFINWVKDGSCNRGFQSGGADDIGDKCKNYKNTWVTLGSNVWDDNLYNKFRDFINRDDVTIVAKKYSYSKNSANATDQDYTDGVDAASFFASGSEDAIVIQIKGVDVVAIKQSCGNLIQQPNNVDITPYSKVNGQEFYVGDVAQWTYSGVVISGITYGRNIILKWKDSDNGTVSTGNTNAVFNGYNTSADPKITDTRRITFDSSNVGKYCSKAYVVWGSSGSSWWFEDNGVHSSNDQESDYNCVNVRYNTVSLKTTAINSPDAFAGSIVQFQNGITQNSFAGNSNYKYKYRLSNIFVSGSTPTWTADQYQTLDLGVPNAKLDYQIPGNTPVGQKICRRIQVYTGTYGGVIVSATPDYIDSCVTVIQEPTSTSYRVEPVITVDKESATIGEETTFTYKATVTKGPTPSNLTVCPTAETDNSIIAKWFTYKDGVAFKLPNQSYEYGYINGTICLSTVGNSRATGYFMPAPSSSNPPTFKISPTALGRYCLKGSVLNGYGFRKTDSDPTLNTNAIQSDVDSGLVCVNYSSRPRVEIWGGDLSVGKGLSQNSQSKISSGLSVKSALSKTYGSWVDYGVFSTGVSGYLASAAKLNGGLSGLGASCIQINILTFSNTGSCGGSYNFKTNMTNYLNYFTSNQNIANPISTLNTDSESKQNSDTNNIFKYTGVDTLKISIGSPSAQLPVGRSSIITAPNATVYIEKDIYNTNSSLGSINEIPQLVIIAKNIIIDPAVTNVDAWLLAPNGFISTCGNATEDPASKQVSSSVCSNKLTIDGPMIAGKLYLLRTFNDISSNNATPGSSENMKLSSDAYLWLYNRSIQSKNYHPTYSRELPPRL